MARIPDVEIERLKADADLVGIVAASGVKLERRGSDHVGCCPFHDDKTPSLVISPEKNLWRCFGACDVGGDPIAWVMRQEGVSFRHAVELLKGDYAPAPSAPAKRATKAKLAPLASPAEDAALLAEVAGFYHEALKTTPEALAYLERRGLTHPDLIDAFGLGYADRTLGYRLPQANRKAGAEIRGRLQALGVLRESGHEHLRGSLVIPIPAAPVTDGGAAGVANLYGRKIRGDLRAGTPDHLYLPGPHRGVFNRAGIMGAEEVILTEALIDALTFWCAGYRHVTSAYGAGGFTDEILAALVENGTRRVLIAFDRDAAGDKGAAAVAERLAAVGIGAYRVNFPKGLDANAYALSVTPARASLGALLRAAEWMAGATGARPLTDDDGEVMGLPADPAPGPAVLLAAESEAADAPSYAGPAPPGPPLPVAAEVLDGEVRIALGDRAWRVRGLERNASLETLKINLLCRRGEAFHVDSLDLLSARGRGAFAAEAAAELDLPAEAIKRDLGQILLALEAMQEERAAAQKTASGPAAPAMTPEREAAAVAFLKAPDLLGRIAADVAAAGVVGEASNALVAYLAVVSRKLEKPLAVLIQSTSAAGKSALMDAVLAMAPAEESAAYSAMTGQSLFYLGQADLKHKALAIAEEEGARQASYALKLLQSQGTLTIASTGKDPVSGKLVTQAYTVEGPVALMMTTTAIDLDEELKNRCLVLTIDESREQTRAIHERQRFEETLAGLGASEDRAAILALHQDAQRLLRPLKVVNPYAERLTFRDDKTRTRRDHRKYLGLIRAIALLHQHQRPIGVLERPGREPVEYVEATLADIAAANQLAHAVLGVTLDELPPQTRRLLGLVREMVEARAQAAGVKPAEVRFSRREVREATGWGDTQVRVHLGRLEALEYLLARRGPKGQTFYELAWDGEGQAGEPFVMGLIDIEALGATGAPTRAYDDKVAGAGGQGAGASRAECGPDAALSRGGEIASIAKPTGALADLPLAAAENPPPGALNGRASYPYLRTA